MKKLILIFFVFFCVQGYARVFDFCVSDCDIWGKPTLIGSENGEELPGNPNVRLIEEYTSPDFELKMKAAIDSPTDNTEDLIVLCAIWANVANTGDKELLRSKLIKKTTGLNIEKLNTPNDILKSSWGAISPLDSRLSAYLTLMLADKIGIIPGSPDGEGWGEIGFSQGISLRYWFGAYSFGMEEKFKHIEKSFWLFPFLADEQVQWRIEFEIFRQILSYEFDVFEFLRDEQGEIDEYVDALGEKHSGVRLLKALRGLEDSPDVSEREILNLAGDFFVPSYPFAERILLRKFKYKEAAYFHYLSQRNPMNIPEMELFFLRYGGTDSSKVMRMKTFLNELLGAKMFEEAKAYGAYLLSLDIPFKYKTEIERYVLRELTRNGCSIDREKVLSYRKNRNFTIRSFEERFEKELKDYNAQRRE